MLSSACFDSDDDSSPDDETGSALEFRSGGQRWQACAEDPNEPGALLDDWGCEGKRDVGFACFMTPHPLTGATLSICVPQIEDPEVNATCSGVPTGPTSGLVIPVQGLCLPSCAPGLCEPGYVCSGEGFCAVPW